MSVNLDKATTRNLLDGLRSYIATFEDQRDAAREQDALALTESREHHAHAILFGDALPRLQTYSFITLLTVIFESRLTVYCRTVREDHGLPRCLTDFEGQFLERAWSFLTEEVQARPPTELWRWAQDIFTVRTCIVESAGNVGLMDQPSQRALQQVVRRRPGLGIEPDEILFNCAPHASLRSEYIVRVDTEFCLEAVTAIQGLFGFLYQHRVPGGA
jgi:hypothetical protein